MNKDYLALFLEGIEQSIEASSKQAAPHIDGVIKASRALVSDLKNCQKKFKEKEKRVERRLRGGIRRTQGDPV